MATAKNPIIAGFYPDPSICGVGEDYYLVNSTFSYFPGIPIMHSKDLVHWEQIGNVLDRPSQLPLEKGQHSQGIFAPAIRYHEGVFYVICTNETSGGNFIVTAEDPAGPWSEPSYLEGADGIDPTIFFDEDGKVYYIGTHPIVEGRQYDGECHIWIQELNLTDKKLVGEPKDVWSGSMRFVHWPEGPHLYKRDGYYYMLLAEGGTERNHSVTMCRSRSIWGPYENHFCNPILTHRHLGKDYPIQCVGHGDLVETPSGDWYMVMLAMRPIDGYTTLGRETFLARVVWENGWPVVNPGVGRLTEEVEVNLKEWKLERQATVDKRAYHFGEMDRLGYEFVYLRNPEQNRYRLCPGKGLKLQYSTYTLMKNTSPTFVGIRQQHHCFRADAVVYADSISRGQETGIVLLQSNAYYLRTALTRGTDEEMILSVYLCQDLEEKLIAEQVLADVREEITISLEVRGLAAGVKVTCGKTEADVAQEIAIHSLSTEIAGGFVGCTVGMYAISAEETEKGAIYKDFIYQTTKCC